MMILYTLPDNRQLRQGQAFELDGIKYPRNWLQLATPDDLSARDITVEEVPPPEPSPPTLDDYRFSIQAHVDATARDRQYDNGVICASYVNSTSHTWAAEAATFVAWRDAVWAYAFTEMDKVQNGDREQPSVDGFMAELPAIQWPS